jgi:hypothetical protein
MQATTARIDSLETPADRRSFMLRLLVGQVVSLIVCALFILAAMWLIVNGIEFARDQPWNGVVGAWIVCGSSALFCWACAIRSQGIMLDRWREALQPLPRMDGSEIVLERKRGNRFIATTFQLAWLIGWTCIVASKWPDPWVVALGGLFFILPSILKLKAMWLPRANAWAPLAIDAGGFEDRSGSDGKVAWSDVVDVKWNGGVVVKLARPRARVSRSKWSLQFRVRHMPQPKADEIWVRTHGLASAHRVFRLMRAYWRFSQGNSAAPARAAR